MTDFAVFHIKTALAPHKGELKPFGICFFPVVLTESNSKKLG